MLSDRDYMQPGGPRRSLFPFGGSIVKPLIWANAIVFIMTGLGRNYQAVLFLELHPFFIRNFQIWRLGTYMFAHAESLWHILFNMWGLYLFGRPLESRIGGHRFLHLYFISGIFGGLVWLLANWNMPVEVVTGPNGEILGVSGGVIGASGAVFGVMMAAAMTFPNQVIVLLFPPIPMRLKTFVAVYAGIEIFATLNAGQGRIAHIAHLGGIVGGFLYMHRLGHSRAMLDSIRQWWRKSRATMERRRFQVLDDEDQVDGQDLSAETDRILDKIGRNGLGSLTAEERRTLDRARERLQDRH